MSIPWHVLNASRRAEKYLREREAARLDAYGVAMSFDPVQTPEEALLARERTEVLEAEMAKLEPRFERVLRLRMDGQSLETVGQQFGVTRERIRQMEFKACQKIKRRLMEYLRPEVIAAERLKTAAQDKARRAAEKAKAEAIQTEYEQERTERAEREEEVKRLRRQYASEEAAETRERRRERDERTNRINWLRWKQDAAARAVAKALSVAAWQAQLGMGNVFAPVAIKPVVKPNPRWTEQDWVAWEEARETAREHGVKRDWLKVASKEHA